MHWTDPQKLDTKSNFWGFSFMAKYSVKFKLQIVREYIKGTGGYNALAQKYEVSRKYIPTWVGLYQNHGIQGLRRVRVQYSTTFKLQVLKRMLQKSWSTQETATHFNIPSPSTIGVWLRLYNRGGLTALKPKPKGRPPMSKRTDYQALLNKPIAELSHEELLKRLEYAEAENAYLKKLEALAQQKSLANKNKPK